MKKYIASDKILKRQIVDDTVLFPKGNDLNNEIEAAVLNDSGAYIWDLLSDYRTDIELSSALAGAFNISLQQAFIDVSSFLKKGIEHKLICVIEMGD